MTQGQYIRTNEIKIKNSKSRKGKGIGTCGKYIRTDEIKEKTTSKNGRTSYIRISKRSCESIYA